MLRSLFEETGLDPSELLAGFFGQSESNELFKAARGDTRSGRRKTGSRSVEALLDEADQQSSAAEALPFLQEAVRLGESELQREFKSGVGNFWQILKTRPYMKARHELIHCLLAVDQVDEAVSHMQDMLRLNTEDNLGIRWDLLEWYCRLNAIDKAWNLVQQFSEDITPFITVTRLCLEFQKFGRSQRLDNDLADSLEQNPGLAARLLSLVNVSDDADESLPLGSRKQADLYCRRFRSFWRATPGALAWLRTVAAQQDAEDPASEAEIAEYSEQELTSARNLRACKEKWYVSIEITDDDGNPTNQEIDWTTDFPPERWLLTVLEVDNNEAVHIEAGTFPLTPEAAIVDLCTAMQEPFSGRPRRPKVIQGDPSIFCPQIVAALKQLRIRVEEIAEPPLLIQHLRRHRTKPSSREFPLEQILDLPCGGTVTWEIDWRMLNAWVNEPGGDESFQPWLTLVVSPDDGIIRGQQVTATQPSLDIIAHTLAEAILNPLLGDAERPSRLIVRQLGHRLDLQKTASSIDCEIVVGATTMTDQVIEAMEEKNAGGHSDVIPMIREPGMVPEILGDFFTVSAEFCRSRIYTRVRAEVVVEVFCPAISKQRVYAVVMGQSGQEIGLMLFFDLEAAKSMLYPTSSDPEQLAKKLRGLGYSLSPKEQLHPADVAAADQFGWPVPSNEAWPTVYHVEKGHFRRVNTNEVRWTTVCIKAVTQKHMESVDSGSIDVRLFDRVVAVKTRKIEI